MSDYTPQEFIYIGARIDRGATSLSYGLIREEGSGARFEDRDALWFGKDAGKSLSRYSPGDILSIPTKEEESGSTRIQTGSARYVERYEGEEAVQWAAEDRAARVESKARRLRKDRDALAEALAPVAEIYKRQVGANRAAMLAVILQELGVR